MSDEYPILSRIGSMSGPAVEAALLGAIEPSDPADRAALAEVILRRGRAAGLAGLVGAYHLLPPEVQQRLNDQADELAGVLAACLKSVRRQGRLNATELIGHGRRGAMARLAVLALSDPDAGVADLAAGVLRSAAERYLQSERPPASAASAAGEVRRRYEQWTQDRDQLLRAMAAALDGFKSHQRLAVLEAVLWLADDLADVLSPLLAQPRQMPGQLLLELAGRQNDPRLAPLVFLMLKLPQTRQAAARQVGLARSALMVAELIGRRARSLAADPAVAKGLAAVTQMVFFDQPAWWERLGDDLADATVQWIGAIGVEPARRVHWLTQLIADGSLDQRTAALDRLCADRSAEAADALRQLLDYGDAEVAERVAGELAKRAGPPAAKTAAAPAGVHPPPAAGRMDDLLRRRLSHPSERVRQAASAQAGQIGFEKFWSEFGRLAEPVRQFAAEKLRRVVVDLDHRLAVKLGDGDPQQRLQAVRVIDLCGLAGPLADAVRACGDDPDPRVRSAVIRLLGQVPGEASEQMVQAALADPDRRVRANAVEALESLRPADQQEHLAPLLGARDNRLRANAIKALVSCDLLTARRSLHQMLADPSADHRLSALWVVEQLQWLKTAAVVLRLAQNDPDQRVRRRALKALGELRRLYQQTDGGGDGHGDGAKRRRVGAILQRFPVHASSLMLFAWPLAEVSRRVQNVQDYFIRQRSPWLSLMFWGVLLAAGGAFLIAAARHYRRRRLGGMRAAPWSLFARLLWQMPLSWRARWSLVRLAWRTSPDCPAAILLTPGALRQAAVRYGGGEGGLHRGPLGRRLDSIARGLFDQPFDFQD